MERWTLPYQAMITAELVQRRRSNPSDSQIVEANKHRHVLFLGVVDDWFGDSPLAGGYGRTLKRWQREPQNLQIFKDHASMLKSIAESTAIRSNGHAWCTADNDGCIGNTLERTRCGNCNNAVIGSRHTAIYQRLYEELKGLLHCPDIGDGDRQRVERNFTRCHDVLTQLGMHLETPLV